MHAVVLSVYKMENVDQSSSSYDYAGVYIHLAVCVSKTKHNYTICHLIHFPMFRYQYHREHKTPHPVYKCLLPTFLCEL